jgi:hypothetical protein
MLFSNAPSLHSYLNAREQVSHPYKTTGKIIVLYILIFLSLDSELKGKIFWTYRYQASTEFNLLLTSTLHKIT